MPKKRPSVATSLQASQSRSVPIVGHTHHFDANVDSVVDQACSTKTSIKISLRFERAVDVNLLVKFMAEISEDECASAIMDFVEKVLGGETLSEKASFTAKLLGVRRTQDVSEFENLIGNEEHRGILVSLMLDPPKEPKKMKAREGEKEDGQLTVWTGTENRPHLGGQLWEAVHNPKFQKWAESFLLTRYAIFFKEMLTQAGKGVSPKAAQENKAVSIAANHFLLELAAHFLVFRADFDDVKKEESLLLCRKNVGLLPETDSVTIPETLLKAKSFQNSTSGYGRGGMVQNNRRTFGPDVRYFNRPRPVNLYAP